MSPTVGRDEFSESNFIIRYLIQEEFYHGKNYWY